PDQGSRSSPSGGGGGDGGVGFGGIGAREKKDGEEAPATVLEARSSGPRGFALGSSKWA
ncbi:unnamed protein product, partial [Musa acuminata var. zebrina]